MSDSKMWLAVIAAGALLLALLMILLLIWVVTRSRRQRDTDRSDLAAGGPHVAIDASSGSTDSSGVVRAPVRVGVWHPISVSCYDTFCWLMASLPDDVLNAVHSACSSRDARALMQSVRALQGQAGVDSGRDLALHVAYDPCVDACFWLVGAREGWYIHEIGYRSPLLTYCHALPVGSIIATFVLHDNQPHVRLARLQKFVGGTGLGGLQGQPIPLDLGSSFVLVDTSLCGDSFVFVQPYGVEQRASFVSRLSAATDLEGELMPLGTLLRRLSQTMNN